MGGLENLITESQRVRVRVTESQRLVVEDSKALAAKINLNQ